MKSLAKIQGREKAGYDLWKNLTFETFETLYIERSRWVIWWNTSWGSWEVRERSRVCLNCLSRLASRSAGFSACLVCLGFYQTFPILVKRFALLRFPYSDLRSLPRGLPFLVRYNTVISVPLEVQQNFRWWKRQQARKPRSYASPKLCPPTYLLTHRGKV